MFNKLKNLAGNVIAHHAGIEDKGEIMHRIEVQIQTARTLRTAFETTHRHTPKSPDIIALCRDFYEDGIVLGKKLKQPWFTEQDAREFFDILELFKTDFERFEYQECYESSLRNTEYAKRFSRHMSAIINQLLNLS